MEGLAESNVMNESVHWPDIILVNGASSSGKSTICLAMQDAFEHPCIRFEFDTLAFLSPRRYWDKADSPLQDLENEHTRQGVRMIQQQGSDEPIRTAAVWGPVFRRVIDAMPAVVAAMVEAGNSVILDYVYQYQKMYDDCQRLFREYDVLEVGVYCPVDILEQRERARGDRALGLARGQADVVHSYGDYDVCVDTSRLSVIESVNAVKAAIVDGR